MKNQGKYAFFALLGVFFCLPCWGQAGSETESKSDPDSGYSFRWLDPDKKIYVLQNRKFLKADRPLVSLMGGVGVSNTYRSTKNLDPRVAYYWSEAFGVEAFFTVTSNSENNAYQALKNASPAALPVVREIRSQLGVLLHWAPWYAKINLFNQILYFDWYFTGGVGSVRSELDTNSISGNPPNFVGDDRFAFFVGTGHQYHLSQSWIARLDFMGAFYRAPLFGTSGENSWFSNYNFNLGIGYRL